MGTATIAVILAATTAGLPLHARQAVEEDDIAPSQKVPNIGQQITPLAPRSARFEPLNPNLKDHPEWLAEQAVTSAFRIC